VTTSKPLRLGEGWGDKPERDADKAALVAAVIGRRGAIL
jgi:hypothetical protein